MDAEPQSLPEYMDYAHRALQSAKLLFDDADWVGVINRAYYAIFYSANAMLELEGLERSKHSGVLSLFREKYVKTGKIETEFSDIYGRAFEYRNSGDYERLKFPNRKTAESTVDSAKRF